MTKHVYQKIKRAKNKAKVSTKAQAIATNNPAKEGVNQAKSSQNTLIVTIVGMLGAIIVLFASWMGFGMYKFMLYKPSPAVLQEKKGYLLTRFKQDGIDTSKITNLDIYYDAKSDDFYYPVEVQGEQYQYECKLECNRKFYCTKDEKQIHCFIISADVNTDIHAIKQENLLLKQYLQQGDLE